VPQIKKIIRGVSLEETKKLAQEVMSLDTHEEIIGVLRERSQRLGPPGISERALPGI
jgi:hypothetical protein